MKWAVYWQPTNNDIECQFFKTEPEAREKVDSLIKECEDLADEQGIPFWDITLLQVRGEVGAVPFDGSLRLKEVAL